MKRAIPLCILVLEILSVQARPQSAANPLTLAASPVVGTNPLAVVAADFDQDGRIDLATANFASNSVSYFINPSFGAFSGPITLTSGLGTSDIVAVDVDANGALDMIVTNSASADVSIRRNLGAGIFQAPLSIFLGIGATPASVATGDFDSDADPDLVVASPANHRLYLLRNLGGGMFTLLPALTVTAPLDVAMGDLDSDGDRDIVAGSQAQGFVSVLLNGNGSNYGAPIPVNVTTLSGATGPNRIALGDLDGDGDRDIVATMNAPDGLVVLFNAGNGTFSAPTSLAVNSNLNGVELSDIDGDGDRDIVAVDTPNGMVRIFINGGTGNFTAGATATVGQLPNSVVCADIDRDGDDDVMVTNGAGNTVTVLRSRIVQTGLLFPGSNEDFYMSTGVNAPPTHGFGKDLKFANAGDVFEIFYASPGGTLSLQPPLVVLQQFFATSRPNSPLGFPEVHVSPVFMPPPAILINGTASPLGPIQIAPGGNSHVFVVPFGLGGSGIILQAFVVTPLANNGFFAAAAAHEIQF